MFSEFDAWNKACLEFDKSIIHLWNNENLTNEQKEIFAIKMINVFNDKMNEWRESL